MRTVPKHILLIASFLFAAAVTGCGQQVTKTAPVQKIVRHPMPDDVQPADYRIGPGDEVELKFFYTPELNDRLTVRPDGKISIMFAQDVQAAGRTARELNAIISRKLAGHLKQLEMVVIVRGFASQRVFVGGEVAKPGPVPLISHENLLQVIDKAGWITPQASRDIVFIVRKDDDEDEEVIYPVNLRKLMSGEDMSQNILVQPGDLVLAPPSDMVSVDRWVDRNIRQMIPISTGVFVNTR